MSNLVGKNVLITGGARGLGRAYALHLAKKGANVGIFDKDLKSYLEFELEAQMVTAETVVEEIKNLGVQAWGKQVDVSNAAEVFGGVEAFMQEFGTIDVVVCNAGGGVGSLDSGKPSELNLDDFHAVIERNLFGTVYTVSAVLPYMIKQKYGKVITVASQVGVSVNANGSYSHYGMAKAAIINYTKSVAQDVGRYDITCNCIAPGDIATGRLMQRFDTLGAEVRKHNIALKRFGTPEECAKVVEFLSADMSDYISGAVIDITGGTVSTCFTGPMPDKSE